MIDRPIKRNINVSHLPDQDVYLEALSLQLNENVFRCLPHTTGQNQNCLRDNRQTQTNIHMIVVFAHLYIEDWSFNLIYDEDIDNNFYKNRDNAL